MFHGIIANFMEEKTKTNRQQTTKQSKANFFYVLEGRYGVQFQRIRPFHHGQETLRQERHCGKRPEQMAA